MKTIKKSKPIKTKYLNENKIEEVMVNLIDMVGDRPKFAKNYSFKLTIFGDSKEEIECYEESIFQNLSSIQQELYQEHIKSFDEAENDDDDDESDENEINKFF
jgi:hypothetical protein